MYYLSSETWRLFSLGFNTSIEYFPDSKFHGPTWGPSGAGKTQEGPMLAPSTLQSGFLLSSPYLMNKYRCHVFSCDQAAIWMVQSVCPSVRPSVCLSITPFCLCSQHRCIMKFSGVITSDTSDVHAKGQGQRSKDKVTEVTTQLNRFRTVTPVWIHIWWWNDA